MEASSIISVLNTSLSLFSIHCDSAVLVIAQCNALNTLANKFKAPLAFLWLWKKTRSKFCMCFPYSSLCCKQTGSIKIYFSLSLQRRLQAQDYFKSGHADNTKNGQTRSCCSDKILKYIWASGIWRPLRMMLQNYMIHLEHTEKVS